MPPDLLAELMRVERGLRDLGRERPHFAAGIDPARTSTVLEALRLPGSEDLATLFAWHDGVAEPPETVLGDLYLLPGYYMLSLGEAAAACRDRRPSDRWSPFWFPFLADGGGDFYAVDLGGGGVIYHYRNEEWDQPLEFRSMTAMFSTVATAFDQGAFYVDPDGYLEPHTEQFASIAAELNPDVPWWAA